MFDKEYYNTLNYKGYLKRSDKYLIIAHNVLIELHKHNLIKGSLSRILDYGCAVGHLTKWLNKLNYQATGYDISEYAINYANDLNVTNNPEVLKHNYEVMFALDVLEHIPLSDLKELFKVIDIPTIVVRVPVKKDIKHNNYYLNVSQHDKTHVIVWSKEEWQTFLFDYGYEQKILINSSEIFNSDGVHCAIYTKQ